MNTTQCTGSVQRSVTRLFALCQAITFPFTCRVTYFSPLILTYFPLFYVCVQMFSGLFIFILFSLFLAQRRAYTVNL
jgi:hypothetical protein